MRHPDLLALAALGLVAPLVVRSVAASKPADQKTADAVGGLAIVAAAGALLYAVSTEGSESSPRVAALGAGLLAAGVLTFARPAATPALPPPA